MLLVNYVAWSKLLTFPKPLFSYLRGRGSDLCLLRRAGSTECEKRHKNRLLQSLKGGLCIRLGRTHGDGVDIGDAADNDNGEHI